MPVSYARHRFPRSYSASLRRLGLGIVHQQGQPEQPGGELSPTGETTRAQNAALQVTGIGATLSVRPRCRPHHLRLPTTSDISSCAPRVPGSGDARVEGCRRGLTLDSDQLASDQRRLT